MNNIRTIVDKEVECRHCPKVIVPGMPAIITSEGICCWKCCPDTEQMYLTWEGTMFSYKDWICKNSHYIMADEL